MKPFCSQSRRLLRRHGAAPPVVLAPRWASIGVEIGHGVGAGDNPNFAARARLLVSELTARPPARYLPSLGSVPSSRRAILARCLIHTSTVSITNSSAVRQSSDEPQQRRHGGAGDKAGERGVAGKCRDREPDQAEDERCRPGEADAGGRYTWPRPCRL